MNVLIGSFLFQRDMQRDLVIILAQWVLILMTLMQNLLLILLSRPVTVVVSPTGVDIAQTVINVLQYWDQKQNQNLLLAATTVHVKNPTARIEHEASTSKIGEDQLFYFQQRGIDYEKAMAAMISGFCQAVFNELPDEFGSEVNQLIGLKLEGTVG
ncbi:putative SUF system FeS cluster assembly, SufBD [Rosa chinensis]|uniref:Putative SUF system FeS cluster assembly, SufBD n=1 Tax=Rosa chinensis TaxID=74649 RepID=A0A2P6Q2W0_ROSCH|nr:UPF0051 protein in atpA 3'region-like [Rosa chinensis]PRQ28479.1 putative SUF system FeS cluster assembly, SufBD [Rosa chinensis]